MRDINRIADEIRGWRISGEDFSAEEIGRICSEAGILPASAKLLLRKGIKTREEIEAYFDGEAGCLRNPFLLEDMNRAVDVVISFIKSREKIIVYGDYDVDGITSVGVLVTYLKSKGATVDYYIPSRTGDGYGLNKNVIGQLAAEGMKLLITVDTGITAHEEADYCTELGVRLIITDHHECQNGIPKCDAVINPKRTDCTPYPFSGLAGVGVAFKLVCAIESNYIPRGADESVLARYADLVSIGTIADVMPLTDENRIIVKKGLRMLVQKPRPGIKALMNKSGITSDKKIDVSTVSFTLAPRLNAAGRMGDASDAVKILLTENQYKADRLAEKLCEINQQRQEEEKKIADEAVAVLSGNSSIRNRSVLILSSDNWHHGVIGIVASRLTEKYHKPAILITFDGDIGKGSGRSLRGLNLVDALSDCSEYLVKFGGHELAAGLTVERDKLEDFSKKLNEYVQKNSDIDLKVYTDIDLELAQSEITWVQAEELTRFEPFGIENRNPLFLVRNVKIGDLTPIGNGKHTKMTVYLPKTGKEVSGVMFGRTCSSLGLRSGDSADIVFNLQINEFLNNRTLQLNIRDISADTQRVSEREEEENRYSGMKSGRGGWAPSRENLALLYRFLKSNLKEESYISLQKICAGTGLDRVHARLITDIFGELGIISISEQYPNSEVYKLGVNIISEKVDLNQSETYSRLCGLSEQEKRRENPHCNHGDGNRGSGDSYT